MQLLIATAIVLAAGFAHAELSVTNLTGDQAKATFGSLNARLTNGDLSVQRLTYSADVVELADANTFCRLEGAHAEAAAARGGETYLCQISK